MQGGSLQKELHEAGISATASAFVQSREKLAWMDLLKFILDWYGVQKKTLIVADRGFESYNLLAHFKEKQIDYLIRVKQERTAMREVAKLPMKELDTDISFTITTTQTNKDKENGYIENNTTSR